MDKNEARAKIDELKQFIENCDDKDKQRDEAIMDFFDGKLHCCLEFNKMVIIENDKVYIRLPAANKTWTFSIWNAAEAFCKRYKEAEPRHQHYNDRAKEYVCINISKVKDWN